MVFYITISPILQSAKFTNYMYSIQNISQMLYDTHQVIWYAHKYYYTLMHNVYNINGIDSPRYNTELC